MKYEFQYKWSSESEAHPLCNYKNILNNIVIFPFNDFYGRPDVNRILLLISKFTAVSSWHGNTHPYNTHNYSINGGHPENGGHFGKCEMG